MPCYLSWSFELGDWVSGTTTTPPTGRLNYSTRGCKSLRPRSTPSSTPTTSRHPKVPARWRQPNVVARLVSGRGEDSPYCEDVVAWVSSNPGKPSGLLIEKASRAIRRVGGDDSELAELWADDAAQLEEWLATLAGIGQRLSA